MNGFQHLTFCDRRKGHTGKHVFVPQHDTTRCGVVHEEWVHPPDLEPEPAVLLRNTSEDREMGDPKWKVALVDVLKAEEWRQVPEGTTRALLDRIEALEAALIPLLKARHDQAHNGAMIRLGPFFECSICEPAMRDWGIFEQARAAPGGSDGSGADG